MPLTIASVIVPVPMKPSRFSAVDFKIQSSGELWKPGGRAKPISGGDDLNAAAGRDFGIIA
jgi:hypothetical protein